MALFQDSGSSAGERRNEADRLIEIIQNTAAGFLTENEADFISGLEHSTRPISPKQLFWLRDIKDKYI